MSLQSSTSGSDGGSDVAEDVASTINTAVQRQVAAARRSGRRFTPTERAALAEELLARELADIRRGAADAPPLDAAGENEVRLLVRQAQSQLGSLGPFLLADRFSDVEVNGAVNLVLTERGSGHRIEGRSPFGSDAQAFEWVAEHAASVGRRFDESNPSVRFRLPNGVRVHAVSRVTRLTHIDCRLFRPGLDTLDGLADAGMFGSDITALLAGTAALRQPFGLIISGGTGAGKTTLLRAWVNATPDDPILDRMVTVEDEQELFLAPERFRNLVEFEARERNVDGRGEYSMARYLAENLRRQTPHRVLLGELRPDGGVLPLLLALGQGIAQGVATTIHAPSAADVVARLRTYAAFDPGRVPEAAVLETIASTVDLIVHVANLDGRRVVTSVHEVGEYREGRVTSAELWRWDARIERAVRTDLDFSDQLAAKLRSAGVGPAVLTRRRTRAAW
ncbi:Flp pilus assembly protein, ATPase CpaF [Frankia casuarinae]|uniref:Type II secretion system protein E n=1 Tax=Frankia casuarinae (strain DSM 45818 / CECT 9043 / HFP020203 / CcI3) TaxID=106370 RepID=Q2J7Q3_FRACC|nr:MULTISPECIES: ATPase, T2SS/T4P/T4SS family [Frankia]ABD12689.1 type II secretion system protein E [Frankia casuarinae]EYT91130.1 Flp pilus assembly protein, ATPase CpaF [Frankia casuarinae]TFE27412.1 CpaF family protein [Frankia sp. B2]